MPSARVGNHGEAGIGAKLAVGSAVAGGCLLALHPAWDGNCDFLAPFAAFSSEVAGEERRDENSVHGDFAVWRIVGHSRWGKQHLGNGVLCCKNTNVLPLHIHTRLLST